MFKKLFTGAILAGVVCLACGGNECDDALDKLDECGVDTSGSDGDDDCEGANKCAAKCVNDASCSDIKGTDPDSKYAKCLLDCAGSGHS